jgi:hypothetical protein
LVKGHVTIQGIDHPIAILPNLARRINAVACSPNC